MELGICWNSNVSTASSSDGDSGSSCSEDSEEADRVEEVLLEGQTIVLPQALCESQEIFKEFMSLDLLKNMSDSNKQHLMKYLPSFPENDLQEKEITLQKLFNRENFRFGSPLTDFHKKLQAGYYRPDICRMRALLKKAHHRQYKQQQRRYYYHLLKSILISRHKLLESASRGGPGTIPRSEKLCVPPPRPSAVQQRVRRRYFQELTAVREEVGESELSSEDENYPEGPPLGLNKKQRRQLAYLEQSLSPDLRPVTSTLSSKPSGLDLEHRVTPSHNPYDISEDAYKDMLVKHRKRRLNGEEHPDLLTRGISLTDVLSRCQINKKPAPVRETKVPVKKAKTKPIPSVNTMTEDFEGDHSSDTDGGDDDDGEMEKVDIEGDDDHHFQHTPVSNRKSAASNTPATPTLSSLNSSPRSSKSGGVMLTTRRIVKLEPPDEQSTNLLPPPPPPPVTLQKPKPKPAAAAPPPPPLPPPVSRHVIPATLSDLDGIDMMDLPVDLDDSEITIEDMKPRLELMQDTYASFFSLLRDIICSTPDHRMSLAQLEDRVKAWAESPISPLNDWYSLAVLDIHAWLTSALAFLAGEYTEWQPEEFVPYLDYKPALRMYQWIGAGRDTDTHLTPLCRLWLEKREEMVSHPIKEEESERERLLAASPPPPRCPTSWVVTPSTPDEREAFREQERLRYENPHKAFTYRMHGYESVVGPVKGMYYHQAVGQMKPRGHTLLADGRPNYVTILALVRDATARLPNGQGTRSDICTLLRDSQYLACHAPDADLNSVVSGALDRLHYEIDPCVKYDTKRKIWIYLHRGRTEDEFERIHQKQQKSGKPKSTRKTQRSKSTAASSPNQGKPEGTAAPSGKGSSKSAKAAAARVQAAAAQVVTSSASVQSETNIVTVADDKVLNQTKPVVAQRLPTTTIQKSLITAATLAAKKASLAAQKTTENEVKSILGKPNRQKALQTVKAVKGVKQAPQTLAAVRRLPDTQTSNVLASVRRITDAQVKVATSSVAVTSASMTTLTTTVATSATTTVLSAVRRLPDQLKLASPTGTTRIKTLKAGKEATSLLDQSQTQLNKIAIGSAVVSSTTASQGIVKAITTPAKSLVKVVTSQAGVRAVTSTAQVTQQQMMLIKQQLLNEQKQQQAAQQQQQQQQAQQQTQQQSQQLIVMKQSTSGDQSSGGAQPQMIVINQQQLMTDQQLSAKQHKQLQQILVKQQLEQANITIQQQQIQQLFLAKQQQLLTDQQKTGKTQQPMFVVKQQTQTLQQQQQQSQQQVQTTQQQVVDQQKTQLQPMIFVKQQQIIGAETQITQQQLQQMILLKQQQQKQQKQQEAQMVLVKQQGSEQQKVAVSIQQQTKQSQVTAVAQAQQLTIAQLQQLQQQQQQQGQRLVTSASLLTQPRVVSSVGGQTVLSAGGTSLIKTQQTPMVAKVVTNAQGQPVLSMESLLAAHQKQHGTALRVATAASKPGLPPQYTVVTMAQPRVIQANAVTQATTMCNTTSAVAGTATATQLQVQTTKSLQQQQQQQGTTASGNIRMGGLNLTHIGGKPVLLASKPQSLQAQNVILASQAGSSGQTVLLAPQGLRGATPTPAGTLTVLQQGTQQILLPPGFQGGTLNIKTLQGLKVIPLAQTTASAKGTGRQQVFARIINPGSVRPVVANIVQDSSVSNTPQPPPSSMD